MAHTRLKSTAVQRFVLAAVVCAAILVLVASTLFEFALRGSPRGDAGTPLAQAIGGPFQLVNQDGKTVTAADLKGKWQLVFFGYTHCPETCPTTLNEIALVLDRLGARRAAVGVVFITVDPERDTPAVLKSYLESFDAPVTGLTGTPAAVAQAARAYRAYYAKHPNPDGSYDMDHSAVIYVMDPQVRFAASFTPTNYSAKDIADWLEKLLSAEAPEKLALQQQVHGHQMGMNIPNGVSDTCEAKFTYQKGPRGPDQWEGVCNIGHMQSPIDITKAEKVSIPPLPPLDFKYDQADLDVVNACNEHQIKVRFPDNQWLRVARKPYRLSELDFHEPGQIAVDGKRPPMAIDLVHLSPEATFLVIEVPIVEGKENPVIKTLWEHIPQRGKEQVVEGIKINAADLLPADRGFYRFPGSLTTPPCNEGVQWFLMKHPIEMSKAQIAKYKSYYYDTTRPLQPLNNRPLVESE